MRELTGVIDASCARTLWRCSERLSIRTLRERLKRSELSQPQTTSAPADGGLRYGDIVEVIDAAKGAGVEKVGIITEGMRRAAAARFRHYR